LIAEISNLKTQISEGGGSPVAGGAGGGGISAATVHAIQAREKQLLSSMKTMMAQRAKAKSALGDVRAKRAKATRNLVFAGGVPEDNALRGKHAELRNLCDDPVLSGTLTIMLPYGRSLSIGRPDAAVEQDLMLEGLGIAKSHCTLERGDEASGGGVSIRALSANGTFVNGKAVTARGTVTQPLKDGDRIVLGTSAHVFYLRDPAYEQATVPPTFDQAIRELVLRRIEGADAMQRRLAALVLSRWRQPMYRSMFEEGLIVALRHVSEGNEVTSSMESELWFELQLGSAVRLHQLSTLRLQDLCPYERLTLHVKCFAHLPSSDSTAVVSTSGSSGAKLFECTMDGFVELLSDLRTTYVSLLRLCRGAEEERDGTPFFTQVFNAVDGDRSGYIDRAEMRAAMENLGLNPTDAEVAMIFARFDVDRSGTITCDEFGHLMLWRIRDTLATLLAGRGADPRFVFSSNFAVFLNTSSAAGSGTFMSRIAAIDGGMEKIERQLLALDSAESAGASGNVRCAAVRCVAVAATRSPPLLCV